MSQRNNTMRLDEILLWQGLITEEQITTALEQQREHGGRLGSHLMRLGFINEAQLLEALAKQFECESVILSQITISPEIIKMIPGNVAVARTAIPFHYDQVTNTISVACDDPSDDTLLDELQFIVKNKKIKLFMAAEISLRTAIADYYVAGAEAVSSKPSELAAIDQISESGAELPGNLSVRMKILLVSDDLEGDQPLLQALQDEEYEIICSDSADEAIGLVGKQPYHAVFVRDTVPGDYIDLIDRLRKVSPRTRVRYYESPGQMCLRDTDYQVSEDLIIKSMQLFTTLLASRDQVDNNHSGIVGQYVDKLCRQMGLPEKDRLQIVTAAYLHDISRYYYGESQSAPDCRTKVQMTAKLLDSLNYPPLVVGILRSMYIDLGKKYTKRLPIEALGGNILTIVDIFCENVSFDKRMSLDKYETVRANLVSLSGRLFLSEVIDAFTEMIEREILIEPEKKSGPFNQIMMYCEDIDYLGAITGRLKEEGFRPVAIQSIDKFVEMYRRSRPDMIILLKEGLASQASQLVTNLAERGVDIAKVPTFLVTSRQAAAELVTVLELGLEDVIPIENSLDLLTVKLQRLRSRSEEKQVEKTIEPVRAVTSGNLEDMNLIDLLQAMGPSCKTAKIKITSDGGKLTMCLDKGKIIYAEGNQTAGAEAVYEGVSWKTGKWVIQPISENELPKPNNDVSNESILMEGCRRLDEKSRTVTE